MEAAVLIIVEKPHVFMNEVVLSSIRSNAGRARQTLVEAVQNRRSGCSIQAPELPR